MSVLTYSRRHNIDSMESGLLTRILQFFFKRDLATAGELLRNRSSSYHPSADGRTLL